MKKRIYGFVAVLWALSFLAAAGAAHAQAAQGESRASAQQMADEEVMGLLWMRRAAEYRALCYQAYNGALSRVETAVQEREGKHDKPIAVVVDCDETVLDNTGYFAASVAAGNGVLNGNWWRSHVVGKISPAMPGAKDFLDALHALGAEVFYVTNRSAAYNYDGTKANLESLGFPNVDDAHLLLLTDTGSKQARFAKIAETHEIVAYLGDNYGDFPLASGDSSARKTAVDAAKEDWGRRYFMLPNPIYGSWVTAIAQEYFSMTKEERVAVNRAFLLRD